MEEEEAAEVTALQQVETPVVEQVSGALRSLLHHLLLADHLHQLVVDTQPATQADVEDIRCVMSSRGAVPVVVNNCMGRKWGRPTRG